MIDEKMLFKMAEPFRLSPDLQQTPKPAAKPVLLLAQLERFQNAGGVVLPRQGSRRERAR